MKYSEIKRKITSLGFAEDSDYEEYEDLGYTYDAINNAISEIGVTFPRLAKYEFEIDKTDTGMRYIDFNDVDGWLDFADTPVVVEVDGTEMFETFTDYDIEMDSILVINADDNKGTFRVYYKKECTQIDEDTADSFEPEIPKKAHHAIPLLASYYLWLDDDATKASQYYNLYEAEIANVKSESKTRKAKVTTGGI